LVSAESLPGFVAEDENRLVYKAYGASSRVKVTATGASGISTFTFNRNNYVSNHEVFNPENAYGFNNDARFGEIIFYVPAYCGARHVEIIFEGSGTVTLEFEEQNLADRNPFMSNADYQTLVSNAATADIPFCLIFVSAITLN